MDDEINELMILADRARAGANTTYSQACIYLIFLMQAAFTLYELAGTRHKNYVFLLIKNLYVKFGSMLMPVYTRIKLMTCNICRTIVYYMEREFV